MGLDLYAGPLTRYHAGLWKTIVQQMGEAQGLPVHVVRLGGTSEPGDPEETREAVVAWQRALREATGIDSLDWPESAAIPYHTDKPDWDGYWAVALIAAADAFPDIAAPAEIGRRSRLGDPARHPLIRRADEVHLGRPSGGLIGRFLRRAPATPAPIERRYPQILARPELWLPAEFDQLIDSADVAGNRYRIGSSPRLLEELENLNARTLQASDETLDGWASEGPPDTDPGLMPMARFGLALFVIAARYSVEHRVPLKLDY
jgi:hypothetical protein